jgi:PBSX family phage terminase large subunit
MNSYAPFDNEQTEYINKTLNCWFNVAEGGKRGGKNVINALAFCINLENHPNKLHLLAGVSISSAKINILDCDGYGILNYFEGRCKEGKYKNKDCLYVQTATGEKVLLISGGAKDGDEKYIKGNTYGMAYVTEANECHPKFLKEVMDRTLSSEDRKIFHDLNPKPPAHWYYTEILAFHEENQKNNKNYGYNYGHFNIFNNLSISDEKLKKVLSTYEKKSIWYKRDILGYRIASEGVLFGNIANNRDRYITDKRKGGIITTGVDFGKNGSNHAYCTQEISRAYDYVTVLQSDESDCSKANELYKEDDGIGARLKQLKIDFIKHIKKVLKQYQRIDCIFYDSAEPELGDLLISSLREEGLHIPVKQSIKIEIKDRIYLFGILIMQDRIKFIDNQTEEIIKGLQGATQDKEADDDRWLDDGTSDIDILDAFNYGIEHYYAQFIRLFTGKKV